MDDLKQRFGTLGAIPVPDMWGEIVARSASHRSPVAPVGGRVTWGAAFPRLAGFVVLVLILLALIGVALVVGALRLESHRIALPAPSIGPSRTSADHPSPSTTAATTCPTRESPTDLRVVPVSLPAYPADVVEKGCRVWVQLGANGAGIARLDATSSAVDATIAPDEITVFAGASGPELWADAGPAVSGPGDTSSLGRIDPLTATWQPVLPVRADHATSAIVGDVVWLRDYRSVHTWATRISDGARVAPHEISVPRGQLRAAFGSMWIFAGGPGSALRRYDPADQRPLATIDVGTSDVCSETSRGFACLSADGHVIGVSASANAVEWSVTIPGADDANLAVLGESAWLQPTRFAPGRTDADELIEIDLATGQVRRRVAFPVRQPNGLWGAAGSLWVLSDDPGVVRVDLPAGG